MTILVFSSKNMLSPVANWSSSIVMRQVSEPVRYTGRRSSGWHVGFGRKGQALRIQSFVLLPVEMAKIAIRVDHVAQALLQFLGTRKATIAFTFP